MPDGQAERQPEAPEPRRRPLVDPPEVVGPVDRPGPDRDPRHHRRGQHAPHEGDGEDQQEGVGDHHEGDHPQRPPITCPPPGSPRKASISTRDRAAVQKETRPSIGPGTTLRRTRHSKGTTSRGSSRTSNVRPAPRSKELSFRKMMANEVAKGTSPRLEMAASSRGLEATNGREVCEDGVGRTYSWSERRISR